LGSGPLGLKYLIEEELRCECKIYCLQAAVKTPIATDIVPELMDGTVRPYIFSQMMNVDEHNIHAYTNHGLNNIFFEMFTQAKYPSFSGIDREGKYTFDFPEIENYSGIEEIHKGIMDFCKQYYRIFSKDSFAKNISGYDAYCPYRMAIRDLNYFKTMFSEFTFARNVSSDHLNQRIETIKELVNQAGA